MLTDGLSQPRRLDCWRVFALILFGALLAARIWTHSGELLLDFGRELYVSWRMSRGDVLYQGLDYRFGPLAVSANALWMAWFGPGVRTILIANLLVLIGTCALLYRLILSMTDQLTAFMAVLLFLCMFGLGHGTMLTQYNFLTPYNHGATYGFLLALGALTFVGRFCRNGKLRDVAAAGFFTGLCFLTKPEMFLACATAVAGGLAVAAMHRKGVRWRIPCVLAVACLLPILAAFVALATRMPWQVALQGTLGGWQFVSDPHVAQSPFYRWCLGTDDVSENVLLMLGSSGGYLAFLFVLGATALVMGRRAQT